MQHDWQKIRTEYITTNISTRKLAEKHGVKYSALRKHSEKEKWVKERENYQRKVNAKITQATQNMKVKAGKDLTQTTIKLIEKMIKKIDKQVNNSDNEKDAKDLDYKEMRSYVQDIKDLVPTLHLLTGKPTEITQNENINKEEWQEFTSVFLDD